MAFLGLDCGGTKTEWAWHPAGRAIGRSSGVQPAAHGTATAAASLVARLREAAPNDDVEAAVAAIAGAGDATIRSQMAQAVRDAGVPYPVAIVGDTLAAAAKALADGPGLLVWAGTGSFAVARDENGALHRTGGRGHLLGDQGSGYDLVRRAAAAVVLAVDGLSPPTALEHALCEAFAAPSPQRLGAVLQQKTQGDIAKALPIVLACAERGDEVAAQCLDDGMAALFLVGNAAVRSAGLEWSGLRVLAGGGVLQASEPIRELLRQRVIGYGARSFDLVDERAAADGAAMLASAWARREEPLCRWVDDGTL